MDPDFILWLEYVHSLPYFHRRLEIMRKSKPPRLSRFLYKYRPIDETNIDRLRDLLVRSKLWLSSPVAFNDPFDMSAKVVVRGSGRERLERVESLLKEFGLSYKERERKRKAFMRKPVKTLELELADIYRKHVANVGVYSFAGDAKSILMWSHYAKDHTGVCIQFERAQDFRILSGALSVEYSLDYPEINWVKEFRDTLSIGLLRKHEGWSYEKEHRIVRVGAANTYIQLDPNAIVGVVIGCRSTAKELEIIESLMEERRRAHMPPVRIYHAQKHDAKYRLVILRRK
jgi:hypothetical protein